MRPPLDLERLNEIIAALGRLTPGAGRVYLVGGATALLLGLRPMTIDLDLKLDPEPQGIFEAIATVKESLRANIELASPDQFMPELPGWRERSEWIVRQGRIDFYHYDFYAQALAKISRGMDRDLADVRMLIDSGRVTGGELRRLYDAIAPALIRFPAIDEQSFRRKVNSFIGSSQK